MKRKKRFSKKAYIYLGFVTMAAVSLFAKPIKHGLGALNRRLKRAVTPKTNLRQNLMLYSKTVQTKQKEH